MDRVPLKLGWHSVLELDRSREPDGIEAKLEFVTELDDPENLNPACSKAAEMKQGAWPFDVAEFKYVLDHSDIKKK